MLITIVTKDREPFFKDGAFASIAIETLYSIQHFYPFFLYGFIFMPDHCHILLFVSEGGSISKIMNVYKRAVTFNIGRSIWQPRFHIKYVENLEAARSYIHLNPVRAHLCEAQNTYPWSSASGKWDLALVSAFQ